MQRQRHLHSSCVPNFKSKLFNICWCLLQVSLRSGNSIHRPSLLTGASLPTKYKIPTTLSEYEYQAAVEDQSRSFKYNCKGREDIARVIPGNIP